MSSVDYDDPPFEQSGMVRLETDPDGKLIRFEAVPPQVEKPAAPAAPFDWNKLFLAAGLDPTQFQSTEPTWTPLANWDTRAAWTGTDPPPAPSCASKPPPGGAGPCSTASSVHGPSPAA